MRLFNHAVGTLPEGGDFQQLHQCLVGDIALTVMGIVGGGDQLIQQCNVHGIVVVVTIFLLLRGQQCLGNGRNVHLEFIVVVCVDGCRWTNCKRGSVVEEALCCLVFVVWIELKLNSGQTDCGCRAERLRSMVSNVSKSSLTQQLLAYLSRESWVCVDELTVSKHNRKLCAVWIGLNSGQTQTVCDGGCRAKYLKLTVLRESLCPPRTEIIQSVTSCWRYDTDAWDC